MDNPTLWNQILVWPILNLLVFLYRLLSTANIPGAFGWSIVALTALVRAATLPLSQAQLKSAKKIQTLKPKLDALAQKYKQDKVKLQQAQMELYKSEGINPAAGCLPLLIQFPVFIALYNVFIQALSAGASGEVVQTINKVLYHPWLKISSIDLDFFGLNLGIKPNQWQAYGWWLLLIPVLTALLQYYQTRLMSPPASMPEKNEKKGSDVMGDMQKQMTFLMPLMIGFLSLSFPVGLAIYWNTFTLFGIIQQLQVNRKN